MNTETSKSFSLREWAQSRDEKFDCRELYMAEIAPLIEAAQAKCIQHGIPFHFVAVHTDNGDNYNSCEVSHIPSLSRAPMTVLLAQLATDLDAGPEPVRVAYMCYAQRLENAELATH